MLGKNVFSDGKMVHWVKVLAAKPSDFHLILMTHGVEGENSLLQFLLWWPHSGPDMSVPTHKYTQKTTKCLKNMMYFVIIVVKIDCFDYRKRLLAILQETLILPTTPISLVSLIVERLLHIIRDDNERIQIVSAIFLMKISLVSDIKISLQHFCL